MKIIDVPKKVQAQKVQRVQAKPVAALKPQYDPSRPVVKTEHEVMAQALARQFPKVNITDAYLEAYPKSSRDAARANGPRLLIANDCILKRVEWLLSQTASALVSTVLERKQTLTEIHRARLCHFGTAGADGFVPSIGPENLNSAGLAEVTTDVHCNGEGGKDGEKADVSFVTKIKLRDPVAAIKELNEMEGVYPATKSKWTGSLELLANGIQFVNNIDPPMPFSPGPN